MTDTLISYLSSYGYLTVLGVGFAEYVGVPVATVPVLVAAGGLGPAAGLSLPVVAISAAAGGLAADLGWYTLVRLWGAAIVDAACGLSSNPTACVVSVKERVARLGPAFVIPAKFIPGAGNLVAPAAGLAGMSAVVFAVSDALGLLLWAGAYVTLGALFSSQIEGTIELISRYQQWALAGAVFLLLAAALWRGARVLLHKRAHGEKLEDDRRRDGRGSGQWRNAGGGAEPGWPSVP